MQHPFANMTAENNTRRIRSGRMTSFQVGDRGFKGTPFGINYLWGRLSWETIIRRPLSSDIAEVVTGSSICQVTKIGEVRRIFRYIMLMSFDHALSL